LEVAQQTLCTATVSAALTLAGAGFGHENLLSGTCFWLPSNPARLHVHQYSERLTQWKKDADKSLCRPAIGKILRAGADLPFCLIVAICCYGLVGNAADGIVVFRDFGVGSDRRSLASAATELNNGRAQDGFKRSFCPHQFAALSTKESACPPRTPTNLLMLVR
jgi:hypothetical protein